MSTRIKRVRTGCWTCKKRRRKCDEGKPHCNNCIKSGRQCEGYGVKLSFDVDDSRNNTGTKVNAKGEVIHGFRGRPRLRESLAKRDSVAMKHEDTNSSTGTQSSSSPTKEPFTIADAPVRPDGTDLGRDTPKINIVEEFHIFQDLFPSFLSDSELPSFIDNFNTEAPTLKETSADGIVANPAQMTDLEENMMLKHFFKRLLPLLDAHPSSPWPQLALKYCDFEVAKSCFIALACIHMYQTKGAQEFFRTGMVHVNNTMEYLIDYLRGKADDTETADDNLDVQTIISKLKKQPLEKQRSNFFVIMLLIHVNFLFSVLESGRSALVRNFCELFAAIVKDLSFRSYLEQIDESSTVIANISWFDTICAVVSPDCRLPYCEETWYGTKNSPKSTTRLMGCPGEIFRCINRFCRLRRELKQTYNVVDVNVEQKFNALRYDLINYREYVVFQSDVSDFEYEYDMRLKCAQCWALAVLVNLYRLVRPEDKQTLNGFIDEFISVYSTMESSSPLVTQMVWPVFTMGCESSSTHQRTNLKKFMDTLYLQVGMGTVFTLRAIVEECWSTGKTWEEILAGQEWFASGIDFLVV